LAGSLFFCVLGNRFGGADDLPSHEQSASSGRSAVSAPRDQEFADYVAARLGALRRLAYLLCQDRDRTDDLVQAAITRLYVHWNRAREVEHIDAYVRTILVRVYLSERRSAWATNVDLSRELPEPVAAADERDDGLDLRIALAALPPRQRATLVLRFYCDLSVEQTATHLGCSVGTVKSQTAKGLAALRGRIEPGECGSPPEPSPGRLIEPPAGVPNNG
jgi:RNA polymerase sigma-70 factor (sigma-E family)